MNFILPGVQHDQYAGAAQEVHPADGLPGVPDPTVLHQRHGPASQTSRQHHHTLRPSAERLPALTLLLHPHPEGLPGAGEEGRRCE